MKFVQMTDHASVDGNPEPIGYAEAVRIANLGVAGIRKSYTYWDTSHNAWTTLTDDCFARDAPVARAAGLAVLPYYAPPYYNGSPAPEDLATVALAGAPIERGVDFPICLDVEWGPQGFGALGLTQAEVLDLIVRHVTKLRSLMGCSPIIYTSYNEMYDLGLPTSPELAECALWVKTAYPVEADEPPYTATIAQPHVGEAGWDPHEYYTIPRPWGAYLAQQTQGDARGFTGFRQCDLGRIPVYEAGDQGAGVIQLQTWMVRAGAKIDVDGDFGGLTQAALKALQQTAGLVPTGIADPRTLASLLWH